VSAVIAVPAPAGITDTGSEADAADDAEMEAAAEKDG
jgi:hypothetical protein